MHRKRYLVEKMMAAGLGAGGGSRAPLVLGQDPSRDVRLRGSGHERQLGTDARLLTRLHEVRAVRGGAQAPTAAGRSAHGRRCFSGEAW